MDILLSCGLKHKYQFEVQIMDSTHLRMRFKDTGEWGTPYHINQILSDPKATEIVDQLKEQGHIQDNFLVVP